MASSSAHFNRSKTARPVVAMKYVRSLLQALEQSDRRPAVKRESFEIVLVAVESFAREIMRRVDQIRWRAQHVTLPDTDPRWFAAPLHFQIVSIFFREQAAINLIVQRQDENRIVALDVKGFGEGARNISKSADFSEGEGFG